MNDAQAARRSPPVDGAVVQVDRLTKRFGSLTAVDALTFEAQPGRVTGFLGPNGAGKSTTLRMLLGLVRPTSGEARILGSPYASLSHPSHRVGAVLEVQSFHPLRTGRNHLRVLAAAAGLPDGRVDQVLADVGLTDAAGRKAGKYSLGMRQRLGIAGAMLGEPDILILDEPANGLDPQGIRWLREFLKWFASQGKAVLVSSHLLGEVAQMADDVVVIHRGRLIRQGTVDELTQQSSGVVVAAPELERLSAALEAASAAARTDGDGRLIVEGLTPERVGAVALEAGVALSELRRQETSLEDVFLELTDEAGER